MSVPIFAHPQPGKTGKEKDLLSRNHESTNAQRRRLRRVTTKKTMKIFVFFIFRVFVIVFIIFATKYTNFIVSFRP
ncbi:MAG: hypothetical protein DRH90_20515 [Deltaproteobacteria bacterium]|nr:MAG: hypothetical protein DRH90_20515 [Deltaproteobacteria bacterium]